MEERITLVFVVGGGVISAKIEGSQTDAIGFGSTKQEAVEDLLTQLGPELD